MSLLERVKERRKIAQYIPLIKCVYGDAIPNYLKRYSRRLYNLQRKLETL